MGRAACRKEKSMQTNMQIFAHLDTYNLLWRLHMKEMYVSNYARHAEDHREHSAVGCRQQRVNLGCLTSGGVKLVHKSSSESHLACLCTLALTRHPTESLGK